MSSQRGNAVKSGGQKYQNKRAYKNNLHDSSQRTKDMNALQIGGVCPRCKETIEWKIKYKKYKPLTIPKKCVQCGSKSIKRAYTVICKDCSDTNGTCSKCLEPCRSLSGYSLTASEENAKKQSFDVEMRSLSERHRRTVIRQMGKGGDISDTSRLAASGNSKESELDECSSDQDSNDDDDDNVNDKDGSDDNVKDSGDSSDDGADVSDRKVLDNGDSVTEKQMIDGET